MAQVKARLDLRSESPVKPDSKAVEPSEDAKCVPSSCSSSSAYDGDQSDLGSEQQACDGSSLPEAGVVTESMIEEESKLQQRAELEEQRLKEEKDKEWANLEDKDKAERFERLQHLLQCSNMYTEYLIARMKRQENEDTRRRERRAKKLARREEKQREEEEKVAEKQAHNSNIDNSWGKQAGESESGHSLRHKRKASIEAEKTLKPTAAKKRRCLMEVNKSTDGQDEVDGVVPTTDVQGAVVPPPVTDLPNCLPETEIAIPEALPKMESAIPKTLLVTEMEPEDIEERMFEGEVIPEKQPLMMTGGVLRPYQIDGYMWLRTLYENGVNGILADEMGLGKTVQCVAMFSHMVYMGVPGPFMVCAPLSTLPNWYNEFRRFSPTVPVMLYHGSKEERKELREKIEVPHEVRPGVFVAPIVITSYEVAMMDQKALQKIDWRYLVVDEGHRIKNTHCRLINALRVYRTTNRLLLTGTPLQNNLAELWSLLNFLLPEIFDDLGSFEAWFDVEHIGEEMAADKVKQDVLSMLHQILTPFLLRRLKSDVDLRIPPKKEVIVYAPLRPIQKDFYSALIDKTIFSMIKEKNGTVEQTEMDRNGRPLRKVAKNKIDYSLMVASEKKDKECRSWRQKAQEEEEIEAWVQAIVTMQQKRQEKVATEQKVSQLTIKLRNVMMQLRKCCSHPFLLEHPLDKKTGQLSLDERLVTQSGKMMVLDRMLKELHKRGHKVLIFSQMTKMLDLLEDLCVLRKYGYCRLDGSMNINDRRDHMAEYQKADSDKFVFLLSTRAGGLGINLTAADTVIIYDSDWNPQCDLQAQDRCHRIGQTRPVMVYRLVTANTIDQRIVERAAAKRKLEKMIIHQGKFKSGYKNFKTSLEPISSEELLNLLNSKDHESEVGAGASKGQVISDADLAELLDRSDLETKWREKQLRGATSDISTGDSDTCEELPSIIQPPSLPSPSTASSPATKAKGGRRQSLRTPTPSKKAPSRAAAPEQTVSKQSVFKVIEIDEGGFMSTNI